MADDKYLPNVKDSLRQDGWTVKEKTLSLTDGEYIFLIDIEAEKDGRKIAVEVKSWLNNFSQDFYAALGQYTTYRTALKRAKLDYDLYLAVTEDIYHKHFNKSIFAQIVKKNSVKIIIFDTNNTIVSWK